MNELNHVSPSTSKAEASKRPSPAFIVLSSLAIVLVVVLGVYETIPVKEHKATAPDPTAEAIHDLQTSLQQAIDQLKALQLTVSSNQAETKRLSDQIDAVSSKLDALQQSFASAQQPPVAVLPAEPLKPKRGAR